MTTRVHRQIRLTGLANGAELRNGKLYGEDHLIVPVVALVGDAVVRPLNSKGAEFVPAEELRKSTHQWAGRPVVPDHPDNGRASANEPTTLEAMGFGSTFNPRFEEGRLKLEAWLNLKRAAALGGDAQKVVDRARAGEMIEVSVGAWVAVLESPGVSPSGKSYQYRWSEIDSDHLAMLPEGAEGACSVDMGCGAPRAARAKEHKPMNRGLLTRLFESLGLRAAQDEGMSDADLRGSLWDALRAVEPGFDGIVEVFPDSGTVIYAAFPENDLIFYRRSFSAGEDGEVSLADDREEVEPVTRFEPVGAEADPESETRETSAAGDCGCEKEGRSIRAAQTDNDAAAKAEGEGGQMATIKELVGRLIACEESPYVQEDGTVLSGFPEERLVKLLEEFEEEEEAEPQKAAPTEPEPEKAAEPEAPPEDVVQLSKDEAEDLRAAAAAWKREQKARKDGLVAQLKGAQTTYTEARLQAKSVEELQELASLLKLDEPRRDYSGQGMPITSASKKATLPDAYGLGEKFTH